jgi:hypothetical protein
VGEVRPAQEDDDIAELQRHMDEYNLQNPQSDGEDNNAGHRDENDVETAMRINEEESQDL